MKKNYKLTISIILIIGIIMSFSGCEVSQLIETDSREAKEVSLLADETEEGNDEVEIPDYKILGFVNLEYSWAFDVSDPNNLIGENTIVVEAKIISSETGVFFGDDDMLDSIPYTPVNIEIKNVLLGEANLGELTVYTMGGSALMKDYIEHNEKHFPGKNEKQGFYDLSDEERNMYMSFTGEDYYEFPAGREYVLILDYNPSADVYFIMAGGYGVFEKNETAEGILRGAGDSTRGVGSTLSDYRNVLTERRLDIVGMDNAIIE